VDRIEQMTLLATYNQWMNRKVYDAAARLTDDELRLDRHAFFGSIFGTLNHLTLGDTVWLKRFALHPAGYAALAPLSFLALPHRRTSSNWRSPTWMNSPPGGVGWTN